MLLINLGLKMKSYLKPYSEKLSQLKENFNFRSLSELEIKDKYVFLEGKKLLNLSSNDYLGISAKDEIRKKFLENYDKQISIPSARLLCANSSSYFELENYLAEVFKKERALLFNSGYHANVGIYSSLAKKGDVVFCDKLNHASIIDGIRLGGADLIPFKHCDYTDLENKLQKYRGKYNNAIIATEALFSMDGDFSDIKKLVELKKSHNAILIVDEAHSFGVYGKGLGYSNEVGMLDEVDLIMATFGKAVGSYGAFCVGSDVLIEYLINFARSFIFSTVFPQISAEFSLFVLKNYIFGDNSLSKKLLGLTEYSHKMLKELNVLGSSYILPIVLGENEKAVRCSKILLENGFYSLAIRYPTVAKNQARLRLSLNASIETTDLEKLFDLLFSQIK